MAMIEKATYIQGLCDGLDLDASSKEGKVILALVDLVTELCTEIDDMQGKMGLLEDYCDELDEDLGTVEEVLLDLDDEDYEDDDFGCDGDCESCGFDCDFDDDDEDEDDEFFSIVCPACGDIINFDSTLDPENLLCPNCGERISCIVDEEDYKELQALDGDEE